MVAKITGKSGDNAMQVMHGLEAEITAVAM